ncbi:MAG: hydantoinase/oxoprolinase family protein [Actinomycetia bacterium]|nr:hydantoinase/oxoprolinase family protein [Actinomycetes bacterium]
MNGDSRSVRMAADIGGTFTDVVLEIRSDGQRPSLFTTKVLTTPAAPADAVLDGVEQVLADAGIDANEIELVVHGTTLATNALIERRGATTALLTTEGFRDSVAMAHENRFEQYDLAMQRPEPLVPRHLRLGVPERLAATGEILRPLDEEAVRALIPTLIGHGVESVAVGFLHSFVDATHERRVGQILADELPEVAVTLSSEVCPEIREYERISTACANAYIQPLMAAYLADLAERLEKLGVSGPLLLMLSNGGLCTLDTAVRVPVGLVESGPAGGALLAAQVAAEHQLDDLLSFDMGGTTAKLCLLADGEPATSREFEVARVYRFLKGSGLPLRIPVIDLVEIGAGGGSVAAVDQLGRTTVGPESAGSEPGPAAYGRGGTAPTVTDADVLAGRLAAEWFAGGELGLDPDAARDAMADGVARPLSVEIDTAVIGVGEIVAEHMANAARVHAVERGRDLGGGAMVAFGGAAPLHACRLADRLGIDTVIVPPGAGVGSAIGFLLAPVSYELVRTSHQRLDQFDHEAVNAVVDDLRREARQVVEAAAGPVPLTENLFASMRYRGQGHEIDVHLPLEAIGVGGRFGSDAADRLLEYFDQTYRSLYTRVIPGMVAEVLTWRLRVSTIVDPPDLVATPPPRPVTPERTTRVLDPTTGWHPFALLDRATLRPGDRIDGPALVIESQTTTVVAPDFDLVVDGRSHLILTRRPLDETPAPTDTQPPTREHAQHKEAH